MNKKKKLLMYAHYYAPDVASTGQILQDLAEGIKKEFDVTVICTVPSYTGKIDKQYKYKKFYREEINKISIIRVSVPEFDKSNKISRIKNLLTYFINAQNITKKLGHFDYIFTISQPPIMGGILGVYAKKKLKTDSGKYPKLIYCIQDFNPEQIMATGYIKTGILTKIAMWMDKLSCKKSDLVVTVGRDLVETLKKRFNGEKVPYHTIINNWIDDKKIYPLPYDNSGVVNFKKEYGIEKKFVVMYSGNIGLYYDLEGLIRVIERIGYTKAADGREVVFAFIGAGSILDKLVKYKEEHQINNIIFIPYQDKNKLIFSLNAADVHWCVNAKGIKGISCPSKFYGIAGVGKPVLGVLEKGSEVEMLISEIGCGRVSEPGDYAKIEQDIKWFLDHAGSDELVKMGKRGHEYLINHLTKRISVSKYIDSIKRL